MRFAILGTHPDGLEMACALVESGRHQLIAYASGTLVAAAYLERWGSSARRIGDLEELLADPAIEAVIVAGSPENRAVQLRRALQSERHVLCVYPPDPSPDIGYEAAMLQNDAQCILIPLLPETLHPGILRLAELIRASSRLDVRLLSLEWQSPEAILLGTSGAAHKFSFPGWDVLRYLGGDIAEVQALTPRLDLDPEAPVLLAGRFEQGTLFQVCLLPYQHSSCWKLTAIGNQGHAELFFPHGWQGPSFLSWHTSSSNGNEEAWEAWDPWPALVAVFEAALTPESRSPRTSTSTGGNGIASRERRDSSNFRPTWQDAIRCLELDDAARRSIHYRRASTLEYPEANEEVGFKGTMTLVGCGLLWTILLLVILANWFPRALWVVVPLLVIFLGMQMLRWLVRRS